MIFLIPYLIFATILGSEFRSTLGACPTMKDPCLLNGFQYTGMCDCASQPPQHCNRPEQTCAACMFQGSQCSTAPNSPRCCPLLSGQAYCNTRTQRCESIRYCTGDGANCPFNDLSSQEIAAAVNIVKTSKLYVAPDQLLFPIVRTYEPRKAEWIAGKTINRIAYLAVFDKVTGSLSEVLADLTQMTVLRKFDLFNQLPPIMTAAFLLAQTILLSDARVQAAYLRRSLNPQNAVFIAWGIGASGPAGNPPGRSLARCIAYYADPAAGWLWRPVEGLQVTVDFTSKTIVRFLDTETRPLTPAPKFATRSGAPKLKPLEITQSKGSSIVITNQQIRWYKWRLMYTVDPIHGLQLFHVRYQADCEERLVLYKMALSEMLVPYGAEGEQWRWRRAFDAGEYGLGNSAISQILGVDVPENAQMIKCTQLLNDAAGFHTQELDGCVAAYERDAGMLYKATDPVNGNANGKRGRQMVLSLAMNVGNYIYVFEYIFHMDGVLQVNTRLTGILLPRGVNMTQNDPTCLENCATLVNDNLIAPAHQHFFNYRMDFDVDGPLNHVLEVDVTNDPVGPHNPDGGAFSPKKRILRLETARPYAVEHGRSWHVVNANSRNRFNSPRGYAIKPADIAYSYSYPGSVYLPQSEFVAAPFWATGYMDHQQSAAGAFPRSGIPLQGLPDYVKGQSLENADSVTWYTFGVTHTTRAEEWPIMNVHQAGFSLVPYNFMSQNSEVPLKGRCA